jgi:hypothetical protein
MTQGTFVTPPARSAVLLGGLAALIVLSPAVEVFRGSAALLSFLWAFTIMTCALSAATRAHEHAVAVALAALWVGSALWPALIPTALENVLAAGFFAFTAAVVMRKVRRATAIEGSTLADALSDYLLLGMVWASAYGALHALDPGAFHLPHVEAEYAAVHLIYFSFVTLTTLGLGDILPISPFARILVAAEAVTGTLYLAVMIAGIMGLYRPRERGPG